MHRSARCGHGRRLVRSSKRKRRTRERTMTLHQPTDQSSYCEIVETVVIGGGQAGLAAGYELKKRGRPFVILDAYPRVGDAWRRRWDSLLLFTPARYNHLPGLRLPVSGGTFVTKDQMADYLETYAQHFDLPVRTTTRVRARVASRRTLHRGDQLDDLRGRQRHRRDGELPTAEGAGVRGQARPADRATAFARVQEPGPARRWPRPHRRRRQLRGRHRVGSGAVPIRPGSPARSRR